MLQKVHFLSFCSIFFTKKDSLFYIFLYFCRKIYQTEVFKRKRTKMIEPI